MFVGIGIGAVSTSAMGGTWNPSAYMIDGIEASLVLDFGAWVFASDPGGWAQVYAVDGIRPTLILDFAEQEYGA